MLFTHDSIQFTSEVAFHDTRHDSLIQGLQNSILAWNHDKAVQIGNNLLLSFKAALGFQHFGILPKYR